MLGLWIIVLFLYGTLFWVGYSVYVLPLALCLPHSSLAQSSPQTQLLGSQLPSVHQVFVLGPMEISDSIFAMHSGLKGSVCLVELLLSVMFTWCTCIGLPSLHMGMALALGV